MAAAVAAGLVLAAALLYHPAPAPPVVGTEVGQTAPGFSLQTTDGDVVSLSAWRGTPVLIAFIEVDGYPCQGECPIFASLYDDYQPSVRFFSIDVDLLPPPASAETVNAFREAMHTPWPYAIDQGRTVTTAYGVTAKPAVFILDGGGVIRAKFVGRAADGYATYAAALDAVLGR